MKHILPDTNSNENAYFVYITKKMSTVFKFCIKIDKLLPLLQFFRKKPIIC